MPKENFPQNQKGGLKRFMGVAALAGASLLHPEVASSQTLNPDKTKIEQSEQEQINKYNQWMMDMSADNPILTGASINKSGREGGLSMDGLKSFSVYLKDGRYFVIRSATTFTLKSFEVAVQSELQNLDQSQNHNESKRPIITEEMAQQWLSNG